ncbi:prepilin-type N-terminal cleavage/methylation domain-containing protein [Thalassolituus sp. LLYu03]|uniref:prepilin-type N-terminal cleavage/methylation domain-containing protein n=1 Tax=Thalassolituus sp. LLYu03 TaxID=3421656 RepID=UPI003D294E7C
MVKVHQTGQTRFQRSIYPAAAVQRGMTLVELVIVIVIISLALVASLTGFSVLAGRNADSLVLTRTVDLVQLYADEILAKRFDESTGNGGSPTYTGCRITNDGESRANYDDVDDYNGISNESPAFADQSIAALYAGYSVSVRVSCDNGVGANLNGAKRVDIEVTAVNGQVARFSVYRGNF